MLPTNRSRRLRPLVLAARFRTLPPVTRPTPGPRVGGTMDTSRLVIESTLPIPVGAVWPAVTEPARISVWFTDCTALPGARYRLEFAEEDGPHVKHAQILA